MDYLCIGHVCQDRVTDGYALGGSASYCSITASLLGKKAGIITSYSKNFPFLSKFKNIEIHRIPSAKSTEFANVYKGNDRTQYLYQRATTIYPSDIPDKWLNVPLVHLGPIADEVDFSIIKAFHPETIIAATPQGWMRQWDEKTRVVSPKHLDWQQLKGIDILILSDEDLLGYEHLLPELIANIKIVVLTREQQPATAYFSGKALDFPVFPIKIVDPTGAGDTFATGFLVKYLETKDVEKAMAYGHVVASFCIEAKGLKGLKNLEKVEERYAKYLEENQYFV